MRRIALTLLIVGLAATASQAIEPPSIFHDPWLNWDFVNNTGGTVDDLEIVVDDPTFSPNLADSNEVWSDLFGNVSLSNADHDGDGDQDTVVRFFNGTVLPGQLAHGGLFMAGSGNILDAYWTLGGTKVGSSLPVTYELTEIRMNGVNEVHMQLQLGDMFFDDLANDGLVAGWTNIRTWVNIPATELDLPDINRLLNEGLITGDSVQPFIGVPGLPGTFGVPILPTDTFLYDDFPPDSFFDVFLAEIPDAFRGPNYEALLIADVIVAPIGDQANFTVVGEFWNLNPQSPEPATMGLLAMGGLAVLRRRRGK